MFIVLWVCLWCIMAILLKHILNQKNHVISRWANLGRGFFALSCGHAPPWPRKSQKPDDVRRSFDTKDVELTKLWEWYVHCSLMTVISSTKKKERERHWKTITNVNTNEYNHDIQFSANTPNHLSSAEERSVAAFPTFCKCRSCRSCGFSIFREEVHPVYYTVDRGSERATSCGLETRDSGTAAPGRIGKYWEFSWHRPEKNPIFFRYKELQLKDTDTGESPTLASKPILPISLTNCQRFSTPKIRAIRWNHRAMKIRIVSDNP